ncbi:MAG TPA: DUF255 domain-containing protein [Xanthomonadaceae bacterium]|nr:DUF255 domain-containing protein [Xanthomonadaceae bacterium]
MHTGNRTSLIALWLAALLALSATSGNARAAEDGALDWLRSDTDAFERARQQQRPVLLYLEAVWCHWCHVMDAQTYADPAVVELVMGHFVPLRIDQDARPDLATRYRRWGWPATIVLAPDGSEIVKRQGYIEPGPMRRLLQAIIADPSPESAAAVDLSEAPARDSLVPTLRRALVDAHRAAFDPVLGGLRQGQKFLDRDSVEYALVRAAAGDSDEGARATLTLDAARALLDPVWGGVYQYSTHGDWQHPHYEKLTVRQAEYLRVYVLGAAALAQPRQLEVAAAIGGYLERFMRAHEGGYYTSQDADLVPGRHSADFFALDEVGRRARGMPRIDTHRYARETGMVAEALATMAEYTGDADALAAAVAAAGWVLRERALPGGGFRHDLTDAAGPYLADTLAMGRACLALYRATSARHWLGCASSAVTFIDARMRAPAAGYFSAVAGAAPIPPAIDVDENISLARFANLLAHYTGQDPHRAVAAHALRHLARPQVARARRTDPGIVLAADELQSDPLHVVVVGARGDTTAQGLFAALGRLPGWYKRIEWWDRAEGPLPNHDVEYPVLSKPAAFVCTERVCSLPLYSPAEISEHLALLRSADPLR